MARVTLSRRLTVAIVALAASMPPTVAASATDPPLVVFAAASLRTALDEIATEWQRETGPPVRISYAGTPALARQIEQGAPADVFISADRDWMDYLAARGLVGDSAPLAGNRLVLVAPRDSRVALRLAQGAPLAAALDRGRLAVANVQSVPAGRYARAALESLGLWQQVAGRLVQTADVRAALRLVVRGEAPLGIVYATDARAEPGIRVVDLFAASTHPAIEYRVAPVSSARHARTREFIARLSSGAAAAAFARAGFTLPADRRPD